LLAKPEIKIQIFLFLEIEFYFILTIFAWGARWTYEYNRRSIKRERKKKDFLPCKPGAPGRPGKPVSPF